MGVLTTLRLLVKIMLFQFNLIKTKEARKTLLYITGFGLLSCFDHWNMELQNRYSAAQFTVTLGVKTY